MKNVENEGLFLLIQPGALAKLTECCLLEIFKGPAKKQIKLKSIEIAISLTME